MYFERQSGGNCRIHAINTFFGKSKITPKQLCEYAIQFDQEYSVLNPHNNSAEFDRVCSDGLMLVSFIIEQIDPTLCSFCAPIGTSGFFEDMLLDQCVPAVLCFNVGHIWSFKQDDTGQWWNLDSLQSGPTKINRSSMIKTLTSPKHGSILFCKK